MVGGQVCSVVQLSGLLMCLLGAAKITHRAQRTVAVAARWHVLMTCPSSSELTAAPAKSVPPPATTTADQYDVAAAEARKALGNYTATTTGIYITCNLGVWDDS